jgi:hypothetical protein
MSIKKARGFCKLLAFWSFREKFEILLQLIAA